MSIRPSIDHRLQALFAAYATLAVGQERGDFHARGSLKPTERRRSPHVIAHGSWARVALHSGSNRAPLILRDAPLLQLLFKRSHCGRSSSGYRRPTRRGRPSPRARSPPACSPITKRRTPTKRPIGRLEPALDVRIGEIRTRTSRHSARARNPIFVHGKMSSRLLCLGAPGGPHRFTTVPRGAVGSGDVRSRWTPRVLDAVDWAS